MAAEEIKRKMSGLNSGVLIDVSPSAAIRPDVLRDLFKLTVPKISKSRDLLRDSMKTYAKDRRADEGLLRRALATCEAARQWVDSVESRCQAEQLHVEAKRLPKTVDFEPFKPGSTVSVYEFFGKFEAWSSGTLSLDSKAHLLYSKYLDASVTRGNRELELRKQDYHLIKAWLIAKYGNPKLVAELHVRNIRNLTPPKDADDLFGQYSYLKGLHHNLVTLMELEEEKGVRVRELDIHKCLPPGNLPVPDKRS